MVGKLDVISTPRRRKRNQKTDELQLSFNHGLGDALMFRVALSHVKRRVKLQVNPFCRYTEIFKDLQHVEVFEARRPHRQYYEVRFWPEDSDKDCKAGRKTKTRICLEHELGIVDPSINLKPKPINWGTVHDARVWESLQQIHARGTRPFIVFHGQAGSSPERKSSPLWLAHQVQEVVEQMGFRLVVLNYDFTHRVEAVPDYWWIGLNDSVSSKGWPLGALPMWHILNQARAFIGIDSGPLHLALTIPRLPCMFVRNKIDFMTQFYDSGLDQIRSVVDYDTPIDRLRASIRNLPGR